MMDFQKTGGPAFPVTGWEIGLTIRDYFAAQAMTGIIGSGTRLRMACLKGEGAVAMKNVASMAYLLADAMLAEREK